jgi:hypothetical protein
MRCTRSMTSDFVPDKDEGLVLFSALRNIGFYGGKGTK